MKKSGCSWKEIYAAFPDRTPGTIHVRCSTRLKTVLLKATSIIPRSVTPASLTKPPLCPEVNDTSWEWDVRDFIGKEYVNVLHYIVEWCPTLEPVHSLEHAKELVDEFEARLPALRKDKKGRVGCKARQAGSDGSRRIRWSAEEEAARPGPKAKVRPGMQNSVVHHCNIDTNYTLTVRGMCGESRLQPPRGAVKREQLPADSDTGSGRLHPDNSLPPHRALLSCYVAYRRTWARYTRDSVLVGVGAMYLCTGNVLGTTSLHLHRQVMCQSWSLWHACCKLCPALASLCSPTPCNGPSTCTRTSHWTESD
jgi:hypothetical protein